MKKLALIVAALGLSVCMACTSVGIRTVGNRPITILIGHPQATPTPVPVATPEVKK